MESSKYSKLTFSSDDIDLQMVESKDVIVLTTVIFKKGKLVHYFQAYFAIALILHTFVLF